MHWFAQAPSNIALIKYMGKKDEQSNLPENPSLSYTLTNLLSHVEMESLSGKKDFWEPLPTPGAIPFTLSQQAQQRFLQHLERLKQHFGYSGAFLVRSSNTFPHGSGLASSASSFAALTICAVRALSELQNIAEPAIEEQARLSRLGSGSSCRSFFTPWALWQDDSVRAVDLPYDDLHHQVIIISHDEKKVSSSEAHRRIKNSSLHAGRSQRATENLKMLMQALELKDWSSAYQTCWREFQDMHQLFATCDKPFSYITDDSRQVLRNLQDLWLKQGDGPIVTMDAGPNIHLLYRADQIEMAQQFKQDYLIGNYDVL
ncbi:diphosphomevalonate/mevalonate 3,5-bisphosphate decarboxylase family protein [Legionella dresdenensis]|uniref:Diphosphomevalonate/mevalonate 3,5-bisphosphate decarboxylase family protein n=1 Tax=Legionella dresdenensis TaxID=450200 RepID=A0ABV8CCT3_9GAMM